MLLCTFLPEFLGGRMLSAQNVFLSPRGIPRSGTLRSYCESMSNILRGCQTGASPPHTPTSNRQGGRFLRGLRCSHVGSPCPQDTEDGQSTGWRGVRTRELGEPKGPSQVERRRGLACPSPGVGTLWWAPLADSDTDWVCGLAGRGSLGKR